MSVSNGIITAPVDILDVHTALSEGTYALEELCKSGKINKWARYKPVRSTRNDINNQSQYETMASSALVNWGFDRSSFISGTSISALAAAAAAGKADWKYLPPTSDYRLGDFAGYNHNAEPPCSLSLPSGTVLVGTSLQLVLSSSARSGGLGLKDFMAAIGGQTAWNSMQWTLAIIRYRDTTSEQVSMTLLGSVNNNITRSYALSATGEYEVLVMITNAPTPNAVGGNYFYMLMPGGYSELKVIAAWLDFSVSSFKKVYNSTNITLTQLQLSFSTTNHADETVIIGVFIITKPKGAAIAGSPSADKNYSVLKSQTISATVTKSVSISAIVENRYEVACGYLINGVAHWYKVTGGGEVSESEAWTVLNLIPSAGSGVTPVSPKSITVINTLDL